MTSTNAPTAAELQQIANLAARFPHLFGSAQPEREQITVSQLITLYLQHAANEDIHCTHARREREYVFRWFCESFGDMLAADMKAHHLSDWVAAKTGWKCTQTRRVKANIIKAAFQWATDGERIARNPFRMVRYRRGERRPEMSDEMIDALCTHSHPAFANGIRFLRLTGCRISEMCNAKWPDMNLEAGVWTIHQHKTRKKTGKAKKVALIADAVELLNRIGPPDDGPVFKNAGSFKRREVQITGDVYVDGEKIYTGEVRITRMLNIGIGWTRDSMDQYYQRLKKVLARKGITSPASIHGIRHRWASQAIANGAPIKLVAAQLGHATASTTEAYYCHLDDQLDAIRAAAELAVTKPRRTEGGAA
jgi:integrase